MYKIKSIAVLQKSTSFKECPFFEETDELENELPDAKMILRSFYVELNLSGHPFITYTKFSEELTFLTPWYENICIRTKESEMLVVQNILFMY